MKCLNCKNPIPLHKGKQAKYCSEDCKDQYKAKYQVDTLRELKKEAKAYNQELEMSARLILTIADAYRKAVEEYKQYVVIKETT